MVMNVTSRCSRAGAEALRHGTQLAADARQRLRSGAVLLRGSPSAVGWVAGWLTTEFPPHVVTGHALSQVSAGRSIGTTWAAQRADQALTAALEESFGADFREMVCHPTGDPSTRARGGGRLPIAGPHRRYAAHTSDISYGPGGRDNLLDIWRRYDLAPGDHAPWLLQVPGGAWTVNGKRPQAYTLMSRMVELGWICVSINYSKSPRCKFPAHIIDVKRAIAWVRENIGDYGGNPDFIAITGGSAGGHLASLAALTANDPTFQPGFESADTTVQAVAPYYGVYDFTDFENMHEMTMPFLEQFVIEARYADEPGDPRRRRRSPTCTPTRRRSSCCTATPPELAVVQVDATTFHQLGKQWPFPRHIHGLLIDRLREDGARAIAYDVQFTEKTNARDDNALIRAVRGIAAMSCSRRPRSPPAEDPGLPRHAPHRGAGGVHDVAGGPGGGACRAPEKRLLPDGATATGLIRAFKDSSRPGVDRDEVAPKLQMAAFAQVRSGYRGDTDIGGTHVWRRRTGGRA